MNYFARNIATLRKSKGYSQNYFGYNPLIWVEIQLVLGRTGVLFPR